MPPYANLPEFMRQVRQVNTHYEKHRQSSLHGIVAALQMQNPNKVAIQGMVNALPQGKRQKYAAALTYLDRDYLNPAPARGPAPAPPRGGVQVMPRGPIAPPLPLQTVTLQQRAQPGAAPVIPNSIIHDETGPFHGWTEVDNLNRVAGAPNRPQTSAFTQLQITHVTHILRAVQQAIDLTLRNLRSTPTLPGNGIPPLPPPPRAGVAGPPPPPPLIDMRSAAFFSLFGPCTPQRLKTVTDNYSTMQRELFGARGRNATGLAVLNESATNANMAETYRRSVYRPISGHILLVVGSGFFRTAIGQAFQANDNTIGTLIHEFAHACIDASDIPQPVHLQADQALDAAGMPPNGTAQCVVGEHDRQLVAWIFGRPWVGNGVAPTAATPTQRTAYADYPLVNADAYGQYALNLLVEHLRATARA
ncbi:MAG TPA: hypothetical protein VMD25_02060 [Acidobacteriaceae bacterium]|nr:hypothetical protein [Acidobacteriaceae bacterium]